MKILALSGGSPGGNAELLLLASLRAAKTACPTAEIILIRLNELTISKGLVTGQFAHPFADGDKPKGKKEADDRPFALDYIMEADAILLGASILTRSVGWVVK